MLSDVFNHAYALLNGFKYKIRQSTQTDDQQGALQPTEQIEKPVRQVYIG